MRHQVHDTVWTIGFQYEDKDSLLYFMKYYPWMQAKAPEIFFKQLTVTEHQKVPSEWDDKNAEPTYDGFILKDSEGKEWHNQYPFASYGQLSDAADGAYTCPEVFRRVMDARDSGTPDSENKAIELADTYSLKRYIRELKNGIYKRQSAAESEPRTLLEDAHTELLELHLLTIEEKFKDVTGLELHYSPWVPGEKEILGWVVVEIKPIKAKENANATSN